MEINLFVFFEDVGVVLFCVMYGVVDIVFEYCLMDFLVVVGVFVVFDVDVFDLFFGIKLKSWFFGMDFFCKSMSCFNVVVML